MGVFKLPELGEGLSEGEVVAWRIKEGDAVKADQTMVEVMTDKATVEVPAPKSGVVRKLYYKPGQMAKVGAPLIEIEEAGAQAESKESQVSTSTRVESEARDLGDRQPSKTAAPEAASGRSSISSAEIVSGATRILASPAVRRLAREMNLDLTQVQGSGERGRVLKTDLQVRPETALVAPGPSKLSGPAGLEERIPFIGIRRKIADRLSESKFTAVHFTHFDEVDFSEIMKLRDEMNERAQKEGLGVKLTYLPFFIKGAIAAMKKYPILNSSLDTVKNEIVIKHYYHFGISVQTDNGLMVGVVRDCDQKDLYQLAREIKEVADRCRTGKASVQDLTGSTITITNPGNIGGLYATPVINFPESVILGMYQIKKRPVVKEINGQDLIVSRPMMYTNITCDHRIVDGAIAAGYLRTFCEYMENPARMAFG